jgi:small subunit ribosomal protein S16
MSNVIRLQPIGKRDKCFYRIVLMEKLSKRNGKTLANIGYYDPATKPETIKIDRKLLDKFVKNGAQISPAVKKLIDEKS